MNAADVKKFHSDAVQRHKDKEKEVGISGYKYPGIFLSHCVDVVHNFNTFFLWLHLQALTLIHSCLNS